MQDSDRESCDRFVRSHRHGSPYHLSAWGDVITRSYSHETKYIFAAGNITDLHDPLSRYQQETTTDSTFNPKNAVVGILPLVHMRHWLFGKSLVSMPFCDGGGVLAMDANVEWRLVEHSLAIADELHVPVVELRQFQQLSCTEIKDLGSEAPLFRHQSTHFARGWRVLAATEGNKVRMLMNLPENPDLLMRSFKAKLRSQIRKPIKEGLDTKVGGVDLIEDFYHVLVTNMRDLGSPVHSKKFILQVLRNFPKQAKIFVVNKHGLPMACSLTLGSNEVLSNPWASSLRRYSQFAPNMLLYWSMLEYACQHGYSIFDFGRSAINEGTYRFKKQWGATAAPLYWYRFVRDNHSAIRMNTEKNSMSWAIACWKRLPIPVTQVLGPMVRRYISL